MFNDIDLRALAEREGPERAYVSLYLSGPEGLQALNRRIETVRRLLEGNETEQQHFEETIALVRSHLEQQAPEGPACIFASWADDYLEAFQLEQPVEDLLWIDSSPYIRPLAELQDEYENFVVVAADNTRARIFFVTSSVAEEEERVRGDVKSDVKKGGWSQKRYERRRDNELKQYVQDVASELKTLNAEKTFRRLVLVGSEETVTALQEALPSSLTDKLAGVDLVDTADEEQVWDEAYATYFEEERASEERLWERIRAAYLRGGRAAVGPQDVLQATSVGRASHLIVTRDVKIAGSRCRNCETLHAGKPERCPVCESDDLFVVDLVNELVELAARSSAETEFTDPIDALSEVGDVAALLRY